MIRRLWTLGLIAGSVLSLAHLTLFGQHQFSPTATLVKMEWTLAATFGVVYSGWFLLDSVVDWRWLRRSGHNGANRDTAEILILLALVLVGVHLLFLGLGVLALLTLNGRFTISGNLVGTGFTWWGQLLVVALVRVQVIRRRLRESRP